MGKKKKRKKNRNQIQDIIRATRGKAREQEISEHGKSTIFKSKVKSSEVKYDRKKQKRVSLEE